MATCNTKPKLLLDLLHGECRWWVREDKRGVATHFCAEPAVPGTSWCEAHLLQTSSSKQVLERLSAKIKRTQR